MGSHNRGENLLGSSDFIMGLVFDPHQYTSVVSKNSSSVVDPTYYNLITKKDLQFS